MIKQIIRQNYLNEIEKWKDKHVIKVITGIRRSGKSTILSQYQMWLKEKHSVPDKQIIQYDFNNQVLAKMTWEDLLKEIESKLIKNKTNYVFLDEIQDINEFEKCVITLFENKKFHVDIYLSGSNSKMFSSSLATLFTGRNIEINVYPLSFKEYFNFYIDVYAKKSKYIDKREIFNKYLKFGGLPILLDILDDEQTMTKRLSTILKDTIQKDVKSRYAIKNITNFNKVSRYALSNISEVISTTNISNFIKSNKESKITIKSINRYLEWLKEALILHEVRFFNIKGKNLLRTSGKYYVTDLGIRNIENNYVDWDSGKAIENLIYIELLRRNYSVSIGKIIKQITINNRQTWKSYEIDFIVNNINSPIKYIQATKTLKESNNENREIGNLLMIKDNFEKIVISLNDETKVDSNGIKIINLIDWLLE